MNVLSLFSGIGGLDLGLERAGMTTVGQVELDPFCSRVLAAHWPEVPRHGNIRTAAGWWLGQPRPAVDVVAGGFPCQPVSEAGARAAQDDPRWLWPAMADLIHVIRPRWVIAENVPGLLRRGFGDVLRDLAALGFDAEWDCVPAAAVGAPHLRDRVFLVAYAHGFAFGHQPKPQPGSGHPPIAPHDGAPRHMADAEGVGCDVRPQHREGDRVQPGRSDPRVVAHANGPGPQGARVFRTTPDRDGWPAEPGVRRVANGVPSHVDRLRSLGNAVVPAVAEHIGRLVMAAAS